MLSVALSGLFLICNIFEETYFCHLYAHFLACFYEIILNFKFLTSHIYFHLDDSELWKRNQSVSQEMMWQICHLEAIEPQKIPIKFCVMNYNTEICYRGCGEKNQVFLQSFNIPKYMVVDLLMVEGLFSLLF